MEIIQIVMIGIVSSILILLIKDHRPEIALQLSLVASVIIFFLVINKLSIVVTALQTVANKANIDFVYLNTVLKIIGISYLASFGVELCKDAGQNAIASKIEFAGKVLIIGLSIPILMAVMDMILKIMP